jgi:hypothetical protein
MKLIQTMKKIKDLGTKAGDLRDKVQKHCVRLSIETELYPDQKSRVSEWIQAHHDIVKEILSLRLAIQRTNLATKVAIELDGKHVTKTVAEWIHRRRDLATMEMSIWSQLGDRNLKEQIIQTGPGQPVTEVKLVRYFDPVERDKMLSVYRSEPSLIDGTLEIINATTELVEE